MTTPTERALTAEDRLTDLVDKLRPAISNAYYDARNAGETMEDAASRASGAVIAIVMDWLDAERAARAPEGATYAYRWTGDTDNGHISYSSRAARAEPGLREALETALPDALSNLTEGDDFTEAPEPSDEPGSPYVRMLAANLAAHPALRVASGGPR